MKSLIKKILKEEIEGSEYSWIYDELSDPLLPVKEFIYNKIKDCEVIETEEKTYYIDDNNTMLFINILDITLFVDYDDIWLKCEKMGCSLEDFRTVCKDIFKLITNIEVTFVVRMDRNNIPRT